MWLEILVNILFFVLAYFVGSISCSIIYSKRTKKGDIRQLGSGNAGATNIARNFTINLGFFVFLLDVFKVAICGIIVWFVKIYGGGVWAASSVQVACIGAFIGHLYPIYHRFKGGKGVAALYGFLLVYNLLIFFVALLLGILFYKKYKIVSMGSVIVPTIIFLLSWIPWFNTGYPNGLNYFMDSYSFWVNPICILILDIIIVIKHIPNIERIWKGTELKLK